MLFIKKYSSLLATSLFFISLFILTSTVQLERNFDMWWHIKSGEIIAKFGIIHYDVFSHAAPNREWYPYEWLFQLCLYFFTKLFTIHSLSTLLSLLTLVQIGALLVFLRKIFKVNIYLSSPLPVLLYGDI